MTSAAPVVLGLDLGTGSLKAVLLDGRGAVLASATRGYPTSTPHPGWAEQDPADWLGALRGVVDELTARDPAAIARLCGIGLCSAAHLPVLLDAHDAVLRPAILWSDQRSHAEVAALKARAASRIADIACNEPGCTWTLPQLLWVWAHEPQVRGRVQTLLSSKDYLLFRLTGEKAMDPGSAAATLMSDARGRTWAQELTEMAGLPDAAFPALRPASSRAGTVTPEAARTFGLPAGVPVVTGTLDSAAELVGCGLLAAGGDGMIRVGSAGGVMLLADAPVLRPGVITYPHVADGVWYHQAGTNACATSLGWIRDLAGAMRGETPPALGYGDLDRLADSCEPGADGLLFHPYLQGERAPHWSASIRGSFTGLDVRHGWPQIVRAVMEGVAFSLRDCLGMFGDDARTLRAAVLSGGVVRSPVWSGILTDVLGLETRTVAHGDSALGAAMLAGAGVGVFASLEDAVSRCVRREGGLRPDPALADAYARAFERYRRVGAFLASLDAPSRG